MLEQPKLTRLPAFSSPYELVVASARRARQILDESEGEMHHHPLTIALDEAEAGLLIPVYPDTPPPSPTA